jgi:excisionase family DNA binding protein
LKSEQPRGKAHAAASQPSQVEGQQIESPWLTAKEAADYLKVKQRTILLWARQGQLKGYTLSGTKRCVWRFLQMDLDAALLGNPIVLPSLTPSVLAERRTQ